MDLEDGCSVNMWTAVVLLLVARVGAYLHEKPAFLKTCYKSDPEFVKCSTQAVQGIFDNVHDGLPEVGLVPLEPLYIPEIRILQGGDGPVTLNASMHDVNVHGLSQAKIVENRVDFNTYGFTTQMMIPKLTIEGNYTLNGRVLVLPIQGKGDAHFEPENLDITAKVDIETIEKDARRFFDVKKVTVNFKMSKLKVQLNNLYNGLKALEQSTNEYLNSNWKTVAEAIRPILNKTVSDVLHQMLQRVFSNIPAEYFIGDMS